MVKPGEDAWEEFVGLISEFLRLGEIEVRSRLHTELVEPGIHVAQEWEKSGPVTAEDIARFYRETDSYIIDLAVDGCRPQRRAVWGSVVRRLERRGGGKDVLVYGDGIGSDSMALARRGHRVTYFDVPGRTSQFARFRFERAGMLNRITMLQTEGEIPVEGFDAVVCLEVLEHLMDPLAAIRSIWDALRYEGVAIISASFGSVGPAHPSHLPQNLVYAGSIHQTMEGAGFANTYYNKSPVNYPMEFRKVRGGVRGSVLILAGKIRRAVDTRLRRLGVRVGEALAPAVETGTRL